MALYALGLTLLRGIFGALRVRRLVSGLENLPASGGAVLAITHFGYFEFGLIAWVVWLHDRRRIRFLATKSAFDKPVIGWILRTAGQIPVDRAAGAGAFAAAVDAVADGSLIGIFPEAGVDESFTVRALKTGAVRLARQAEVPLIPIAIWGGQRLMTRGHKVGFFERFRIPVAVSIGAPVIEEGEVHVATEKLRTDLRGLLAGIQADYPDDGAGQWWQPRALGGTAPTPEEAVVADAALVKRRALARAAKAEKRR